MAVQAAIQRILLVRRMVEAFTFHLVWNCPGRNLPLPNGSIEKELYSNRGRGHNEDVLS